MGGRFGPLFIKDFQSEHRYVLIWVLTDKLKFQCVGYMDTQFITVTLLFNHTHWLLGISRTLKVNSQKTV